MKILSKSVSDTLKIGRKISANLRSSDIICLFGQLGSGKTVLTKGIASGLGINPDKIISPTFVLIRQHEGRLPFFHFDLYRLKSLNDILALGYEEYFYSGAVTVVEWADRLGYLMPKEFLKVELTTKGKESRLLKFSAFGSRYKDLLRKIDENISH